MHEGRLKTAEGTDDELGEAEVGRSPVVASPNSDAGFAGGVGGDSGQGGPIFDDQEEIGCGSAWKKDPV